MKPRLLRLIAACLLVVLAGAAAAEPAQWYLMARHGECAPIAVLERKVTGASTISHPDELIRHLQAQGHAVEVVSRDLQLGMVQLNVPAKSLHLVLVKPSLCREFIAPR
jgi:hypothetical protein